MGPPARGRGPVSVSSSALDYSAPALQGPLTGVVRQASGEEDVVIRRRSGLIGSQGGERLTRKAAPVVREHHRHDHLGNGRMVQAELRSRGQHRERRQHRVADGFSAGGAPGPQAAATNPTPNVTTARSVPALGLGEKKGVEEPVPG